MNQSARAFIQLLLASILFSGCSDRPVIADNSTVVVQPGVGISNVLTFGMTAEQIFKATGDARLRHIRAFTWRRLLPGYKDDRYIQIPSLGAITGFPGTNGISSIDFFVAKNEGSNFSFRGKLGDKLSFKDGHVTREQI